MNSRQTEVQGFPPQYERPLSHLWMMDHRGGGRGETQAMTGRKEVFQIKLVKRYKVHLSYRILQKWKKKRKDMYRTSKNENNCFFPRCISRGDYATRLMSHTKMVAKSARVQKLRNCTEAKRLIEKHKKNKNKVSAKKEKRKRNSWMRDWAMEEKKRYKKTC